MNLRDKLNQNSLLVTIVAVVVLGLALAYLVYQGRGRGPGGAIDVWYYDLKSNDSDPIKRLFPAKNTELPPIKSPSDAGTDDASGVRASVFSCGSCEDHSQMFIGYLETYTQEYKDNMRQAATATPGGPNGPAGPMATNPMMPGMMQKGHLLSRADNIRWVESMTPEAMQVQAEIMKRCGGTDVPKACNPGTK
jgi:hypothetical protein